MLKVYHVVQKVIWWKKFKGAAKGLLLMLKICEMTWNFEMMCNDKTLSIFLKVSNLFSFSIFVHFCLFFSFCVIFQFSVIFQFCLNLNKNLTFNIVWRTTVSKIELSGVWRRFSGIDFRSSGAKNCRSLTSRKLLDYKNCCLQFFF